MIALALALAACSSGGSATTTTSAGATTTTVAPTTTTPAPPPTTATTLSTGRMAVAPGGSDVMGAAGPERRYQVEVEEGAGVDPAAFAADVDRILGDRHGWTAPGTLRLQRVSSGAVDFRVVLATPATTDDLCAPLETNGRYSCFQDGRSVINLDRWTFGAEDKAKLALPEYRQYVISHEVGHALGHGHVGCPSAGALAPVMMQQTKGIGSCGPNPWPFPDE